ncbi:thiamine-phosphate kinase [Galactobacter sp.]|uniref:thiamine-phosphate kinase n=1 Tax=Galactobacter sp. TaxID=2676125 RepID=UPI0025BCB689|nr:thiamine-phosphate kinase [Galactobacter sp.]
MNLPQTVSDVDESSIISLLNRHYPQPTAGAVKCGIGDDAAILGPGEGKQLVTVDTLVHGRDFLDSWPCGYRTTGADVGWKSAAQNLSDINAMGGVPLAGFVTLSLPPQTPLAWVEAYAEGVAAAAHQLGATTFGVAGGDLSSSAELQVGMTVIGQASHPVLRGGARPGDRVLLAGSTPGMAHVGLSLLLSTDQADVAEGWDAAATAVAAAQLRPRPPLGTGAAAAERLTSLMDVSDGLMRDAARLAASSSVVLRLDRDALEREATDLAAWGGRHVRDALRAVLYGGEDFGLLGTSPSELPVPEGFRQIGVVVPADAKEGLNPAEAGPAGSGVWLGDQPLSGAAGFDHFAPSRSD